MQVYIGNISCHLNTGTAYKNKSAKVLVSPIHPHYMYQWEN